MLIRSIAMSSLVLLLAAAAVGCEKDETSAPEPPVISEAADPQPRTAALRALVDAQLPAVRTSALTPAELRRRWGRELDARTPTDGVVFIGPSQRTTVLRFASPVQTPRIAKGLPRVGRQVSICGPYLVVSDPIRRKGLTRAPKVRRPIDFLADRGACRGGSADLVITFSAARSSVADERVLRLGGEQV